MTRAQSMDVINDSTTLQSRIDTVLAAPIMEWDNSDEIQWQPGDPVYPHPSVREDFYVQNDEDGDVYWFSGGNYVRRMYDLIYDYHTDRMEATMGCQKCLVSGALNELECWNCGGKYDNPTLPLKHSSYGRYVSMEPRLRRANLGGMTQWLHAMTGATERAVGSIQRVSESINGLHVHFTIDDGPFRREMARLNQMMYSSMAFDLEPLSIFSSPRRRGRSNANLWTLDEWLNAPDKVTVHILPNKIAQVPPRLKVFDFDLGLRKPMITNFNYRITAPWQGVTITIPRDIPRKRMVPPELDGVRYGFHFEFQKLAQLSTDRTNPTSTLATSNKRRRHI